MKKFGDAKKDKILERITLYLIDENFPVEHLRALFKITTWFNWSENSERDVFEFSEQLHKYYGNR